MWILQRRFIKITKPEVVKTSGFIFLYRGAESNRRPPGYESDALTN